MVLINEFKLYTATKLDEMQEMQNWQRTVWAPACVFHGNPHFGTLKDNLTVAY